MRNLITTILTVLILTVPTLSLALTGKVVSVADGDTITVLDRNNRQHKIRLYGIDTPEKRQAYGQAAKKHTAKLVAGKKVKVREYDTDKYGRTVGVVVVDGKNVNKSLLIAGYAWQYRKYCKASFCNDWIELEQPKHTGKASGASLTPFLHVNGVKVQEPGVTIRTQAIHKQLPLVHITAISRATCSTHRLAAIITARTV